MSGILGFHGPRIPFSTSRSERFSRFHGSRGFVVQKVSGLAKFQEYLRYP